MISDARTAFIPMPSPVAPRASSAAVKKWYHQDCFAIFGIRDARSAQGSPGCVTLTKEYRFGAAINELANAVAYRGVLQPGARQDARTVRQDIVLVDVDGLGDELATTRRGARGTGRWWPVGALLAQALAEARMREAPSRPGLAGIVVPYRDQVELVQELLNESRASPQIEVGTSHRFQGREFDTVIFDLVEDGRDRGWVARGTLDGTPWEANGLRLFNVGITRAQRTLYLIANAAAIARARTGPLRAVRDLLGTGPINVVRAAEILGLPDAPAGDTAARDVWQALRGHATLIDLYDDDILPSELARRFDEASESIWMWSPWVGHRSRQLLPHLRDSQARGVRVHVVVLPRDQVTRHLAPRHEELAEQVSGTVYL